MVQITARVVFDVCSNVYHSRYWVSPNLMLVSHCGEYMANGLSNAVRHEFVTIANDRKHSRSFYGVSTVILVSPVANVWRMGLRMQFAINSQWSLVSHCGEYPCECKKIIFAANRPFPPTFAIWRKRQTLRYWVGLFDVLSLPLKTALGTIGNCRLRLH